MKALLSTQFLFIGITSLLAQYPSNLHNEDLRIWLKTNLYDAQFNDLGYNSARENMYSFTDEVSNKIYCIYTDFEMNAEVTTYPNPINAEHIVPQSFYGGVSPMKSDIHNIRPSHQSANSARSNYGFGEVNDGSAQWYGITNTGNYASLGSEPSPSDDFSEGINGLWEPQEDRKGDVARQIFYFYTMYPAQAGALDGLVDLNLAYLWHTNDPADALEIQRNNRIEQVQGNSNPYISYPELVYEAWLWVASAGCTDPGYVEFDPAAAQDDGSCATLLIYGCRYTNATNYDLNANVDDNGSCVFNELCLGDFNADQTITSFDLSQFLSIFGAECF